MDCYIYICFFFFICLEYELPRIYLESLNYSFIFGNNRMIFEIKYYTFFFILTKYDIYSTWFWEYFCIILVACYFFSIPYRICRKKNYFFQLFIFCQIGCYEWSIVEPLIIIREFPMDWMIHIESIDVGNDAFFVRHNTWNFYKLRYLEVQKVTLHVRDSIDSSIE